VFACAIAAEMLFDNERALDHIAVIGDGEEMPDPLRAARARNLLRLGEFARAAEDLNRVLIIGPEDYGVNYFLGVLCLSHGRAAQARNLFLRAHADYMVDTLEFQFWQMQQALFDTADATAGTAKNA
jgi:Flp pilus assembly protein TadD